MSQNFGVFDTQVNDVENDWEHCRMFQNFKVKSKSRKEKKVLSKNSFGVKTYYTSKMS